MYTKIAHLTTSFNRFLIVFQSALKGTDAIDRSDVYYTISDLDYPVSALMQSPFKVSKGTATSIGLSKKEVGNS